MPTIHIDTDDQGSSRDQLPVPFNIRQRARGVGAGLFVLLLTGYSLAVVMRSETIDEQSSYRQLSQSEDVSSQHDEPCELLDVAVVGGGVG
eukprot:CAMPEP_0115856306 /NCGR_PEP_ID=MMETSP0287-20121206/14983_1 /TAXON_ID=412157 /ORGANISM="Chrysochromulina rotalis, Strain UIO044" /LENGTH=90 /DNA_ID=CAMNT_0003310473 /DNA_START=108 /DNA_END=376 /DNA_ORIENTATION=-